MKRDVIVENHCFCGVLASPLLLSPLQDDNSFVIVVGVVVVVISAAAAVAAAAVLLLLLLLFTLYFCTRSGAMIIIYQALSLNAGKALAVFNFSNKYNFNNL